MKRTLVAFHAHPDDESVLTAGTMAAAAAQGHRVVLVLATDGGLSRPDADVVEEGRLGARRLQEALASARMLGIARVVYLGHADSGPGRETTPAPPGRTRFVDVPVDEAGRQLAVVLRTERADVLLDYDRNGGYGHPDHLRVHEVAAEAARLAGTPRLLHATAPRDTVRRALDLVATFRRGRRSAEGAGHADVFSARQEITHRIPVRRYAALKRASLRAHASQTAWRSGTDRVLAVLLRLPWPVFDVVVGREWYIDPDHRGPISGDVFSGLP